MSAAHPRPHRQHPSTGPHRPAEPRGCVAVVVWPLRVVVLVFLLPLRLLWSGLTWLGRQLARAMAVLGRWLHHRVLLPVVRGVAWWVQVVVLVPLGWLWRYLVLPAARGVAWVVRVSVVVPALWSWRWLLRPTWRVVVRTGRMLTAPVSRVWREVVVPAARGVREVLVVLGVAPPRRPATPPSRRGE